LPVSPAAHLTRVYRLIALAHHECVVRQSNGTLRIGNDLATNAIAGRVEWGATESLGMYIKGHNSINSCFLPKVIAED
jgi:hypothetical protein